MGTVRSRGELSDRKTPVFDQRPFDGSISSSPATLTKRQTLGAVRNPAALFVFVGVLRPLEGEGDGTFPVPSPATTRAFPFFWLSLSGTYFYEYYLYLSVCFETL